MQGADDPTDNPAPVAARPPVLQVIVEAAPGPDLVAELQQRFGRLGCPYPEYADEADGGIRVSGLLSGLPSRDLVPVACRLLSVAGVRRVSASYLAPDGTVLAEVTLAG